MTISLTEAPEPNDYSVIVSAGPFSLEVGEMREVCFAILGGNDLVAMQEHVDVAQMILDGLVDEVPPLTLAPPVTRLLPNAPNPFSRATVVRFDLARSGMVRVAIYNVAGQLVHTLTDRSYAASRHTLIWDGRDRYERDVPGGVYFVHLKTNNRHESRPLIRLR